ncbi:3-deoxy-D-manno-octulosonic acid transferase [Bordetella genomosp. 11]|uniref:3-deoxy-D-manno-octulosonic acid transferase n=1 Tax=Bordetella genomosp. 11 TaxID=1416808 RepID=A0A261USZ5_9BORD|nr:3-deoxy-D-manno-octulosonic acid transferase [Bordetella genomosp. 11]OZI64462.1 3-deoxy-D-manno-octulosonic acid transferase [Bordetella genomosp. 11]
MNRTLYSCLARALAPLLAARVLMRARFDSSYGTAIGERFGWYRDAMHTGAFAGGRAMRARPVWVHAVSLGETRAAQPLIQALLDRQIPVLLTHMTATGRREGSKLFAVAIERGQLRQAWLPYDLPGACSRFFATMNPVCGVLIEREVWPNLIHEANRRSVPMIMASARLSARSARRGLHAGRVLREAYAGLDIVLAQSEADAQRLRAAGARRVETCGNLKFDSVPSEHQMARGRAWRAAWDRPVITVASTHEGEEAEFARAVAGRAAELGNALLVVVPRHPERFDAVEKQLQACGLRVARRTAIDPWQPQPAHTQVLLGDSMGELATYYAASDVAIVAGSFIAEGGQNLIEACAAGVPVVVGPHARNFQQVTDEAIAAGAALRRPSAGAAIDAAAGLLGDVSAGAAMAAAGLRYVASHAGVVRRTMMCLEAFLSTHGAGVADALENAASAAAAREAALAPDPIGPAGRAMGSG